MRKANFSEFYDFEATYLNIWSLAFVFRNPGGSNIIRLIKNAYISIRIWILANPAEDTEVTKYQIKDYSFLCVEFTAARNWTRGFKIRKPQDHLQRHY